ncbi:MAG TPA: DMT family transporter, partial [Candidatus Rubrimentiphilum sp.]|nr:DMT family transporter [Candidatus Rubrimentiphilum sp.]
LSGLPAIDWIAFAFAVIFPILLTYPIWSWGLQVLGAGRASLFQFIVPLIAGALAIALLHNRIEPHQIVGAVICIAGMAVSQLLGGFSFTAFWAERTVSLK